LLPTLLLCPEKPPGVDGNDRYHGGLTSRHFRKTHQWQGCITNTWWSTKIETKKESSKESPDSHFHRKERRLSVKLFQLPF
jgi:hypothetical protein